MENRHRGRGLRNARRGGESRYTRGLRDVRLRRLVHRSLGKRASTHPEKHEQITSKSRRNSDGSAKAGETIAQKDRKDATDSP
ncbi:hypothetical protein AKJ09_05325 [Labilithrix luteola]|uniref:Uncharacterized protein n=1 Tax=Labilithrix luteola TaxID=1391654 RepID=A0A0K1PZ34_9BACT|nr:hypothetical protein AKJ09_05325 [Labilithrix luteola]